MAYALGDYELIKRLGQGGMGEVFLARRLGMSGFEKLTVVKTLLPHLADDDELRNMFLDEARLAARLNHPNVCQIYELGEDDGTYFIAMEYVCGRDVTTLLAGCEAAGTPLPIHLISRIVSDAAAGLHYSHELTDNDGNRVGLIHRDVSPQNILVTFEGSVKVIDFGVAKAAGRLQQTRAGQLKGKAAYMSPEQVKGEPMDHRSDVWALGVVLHELLTGERLFDFDNQLAIFWAITEGQTESPSTKREEVPESLDAIVMKCLSVDADERYATAKELHLALEDWMFRNGEPASRANLGAFVESVYEEEIAAERKAGPLWDVASSDALESLATIQRMKPTSAANAMNGDRSPNSATDTEPPTLKLPSLAADIMAVVHAADAALPPVASPQPARDEEDHEPTVAMLAVASEDETVPPLAPRSRAPSSPRVSLAESPTRQVPFFGPGPSITPGSSQRKLPIVPLVAGAVVVVVVVVGFFAVRRGDPDGPGRPPPAAGASDKASLSVSTDPAGVIVTLNGRKLGKTPLSAVEVDPVGEATISLKGEGLVERTETITLQPGARVNLSYTLGGSKVSLRLESEPAGATVSLGGAVIGTTPFVWDGALYAAAVQLSFDKQGYKTAVEPVVAAAGLLVRPTLERATAKPVVKPRRVTRPHHPRPKPKRRVPSAAPIIPTFED